MQCMECAWLLARIGRVIMLCQGSQHNIANIATVLHESVHQHGPSQVREAVHVVLQADHSACHNKVSSGF